VLQCIAAAVIIIIIAAADCDSSKCALQPLSVTEMPLHETVCVALHSVVLTNPSQLPQMPVQNGP
jgi:hypothetical protein